MENPAHRDHAVQQMVVTRKASQIDIRGEENETVTPEEQNMSQNQRPTHLNPDEYIHASEVEAYIKSYVDRLLMGAPRYPLAQEAQVSQLVDQIANISMRDSEIWQISQGPSMPTQRSSFSQPQFIESPPNRARLAENGNQPPTFNISTDSSPRPPSEGEPRMQSFHNT